MFLIMDLWHTMSLALLLLNPSACQSHLPRNLTSNRGVLDKMQLGSKKKVSLKNKILFRNFYCVYLCACIHVIAGILWKPEEGIGNFIGGVSPSKWKAPPKQWLSYEGKGSLLLYLPEPVHLPLQLHPLLTWDSIFGWRDLPGLPCWIGTAKVPSLVVWAASQPFQRVYFTVELRPIM